MIRVLKRDGSVEDFHRRKLAGCMWRAMEQTSGRYRDAVELSVAIQVYLRRRGCRCVSSAAVLEMAVKVLRRVRLGEAADLLEEHHTWRDCVRRGLVVKHDDGRVTCWDKSWLAELVCRSWGLLPGTGRIIAGELEAELLATVRGAVARRQVVDGMNSLVVAFGLADAVSVRQYVLE
ncbi:MAG TPA: ATP cone domain-containing protein [Phycisphaerae bacterium]|nr:ATP cone domain-containing protein [Phycisphaerae bacterium]